MLVRVLDFETTGFPPNAAVCEVGWTDLVISGTEIEIRPTVARLTNPGRPIPAEVTAIHGITDEMVAGALPTASVFAEVMDGADGFCAHNCEFERQFFAGGGKAWACTYKVALVQLPDAPSHKNALLPEIMGLALDPALSQPAHRAGPDTYVTAHILAHFLRGGLSIDEAFEITERPREISRMPFGKHKGQKIVDLPDRYLRWCIDELKASDIVAVMRREVQRRAA